MNKNSVFSNIIEVKDFHNVFYLLNKGYVISKRYYYKDLSKTQNIFQIYVNNYYCNNINNFNNEFIFDNDIQQYNFFIKLYDAYGKIKETFLLKTLEQLKYYLYKYKDINDTNNYSIHFFKHKQKKSNVNSNFLLNQDNKNSTIKRDFVLDENIFKIIVYDLFSSYSNKTNNDFIIIPEVKFFSKISDFFILLNNDIITIEIKSELDSLKRLVAQINGYSLYSNYIYIFIDKKHINDLLKIINSNEINLNNMNIKFLVIDNVKIDNNNINYDIFLINYVFDKKLNCFINKIENITKVKTNIKKFKNIFFGDCTSNKFDNNFLSLIDMISYNDYINMKKGIKNNTRVSKEKIKNIFFNNLSKQQQNEYIKHIFFNRYKKEHFIRYKLFFDNNSNAVLNNKFKAISSANTININRFHNIYKIHNLNDFFNINIEKYF